MARKWVKPSWGTQLIPIGVARLRNRADEALHNHSSNPHIVYAGYSQTAPHYHLFKCTRLSDPPRRTVTLIPFNPMRFSEDSKARRGGCSRHNCLFEAVMMNEKGSQTYCEHHASRVSPTRIPCPWTSIETCTRVLRLEDGPYSRPCPTCRAFEKAAS